MNAQHLVLKSMLNKEYPFKMHTYIISPLAIILAIVIFNYGWWGEHVWQYFLALRTAFPIFTSFFRIVSNLGNAFLDSIYMVIFLYSLYKKNSSGIRFALCFAIVGLVTMLIVVQLMKYGLGMPRPFAAWPPSPWTSDRYASFPSGHTTHVIISAIPLALLFRNKLISLCLSLLIACMGLSRLWLGFHHPIDIIGGIVVGSLSAWFIYTYAIYKPKVKDDDSIYDAM